MRQSIRIRTLRALWLVLLLVAALPAPAAAVRHDVYRFVGTVVKWDAATNTLDIKTPETAGKVLHIVMREDAPVTRSGTKVPRSELKPGLSVIVDAV
jgi:hypothetical protein